MKRSGRSARCRPKRDQAKRKKEPERDNAKRNRLLVQLFLEKQIPKDLPAENWRGLSGGVVRWSMHARSMK